MSRIPLGSLVSLIGFSLVLVASRTIAFGPLGNSAIFDECMMAVAVGSLLGLGFCLPRSLRILLRRRR